MVKWVLNGFWLVTAGFAPAAVWAQEQPAEETAPEPEPVVAPAQAPITTEADLQQSRNTPPRGSIENTLFRFGPLTLRPGASYTVSYSDNIFGGRGVPAGAEKDDVIHRLRLDLSATVTDGGGELLIPDMGYSPEFVLLHNNSDRNTVNHFGRFSIVKLLPKTSISLRHNSSSVADIFAEAGQFERQDSHETSLLLSYEIGGKTSLESETTQELQSRELGLSAQEWRENLWLNYQLSPKVDAAFGLVGGYGTVDDGPESLFTAAQARLKWYPTEKLTFEVRGGVEWRSFSGEDGENILVPIAGATASYNLLRGTQLAASVDRKARASLYLVDQLAIYNSASLNLHQDLPFKLFVDLAAMYAAVEYESVSRISIPADEYDFYNIQLSGGYRWTGRTTTSVFYRRINRSAGGGLDSFEANEIGMNLGYHF